MNKVVDGILRWGMALLLILAFGATAALAQSAERDTTARAVTDPNEQPYRSERSVLYHVLAAPSYVLHGVTRPIGWGLLYVERNFPGLFEPEPRRRGVLPIVELGGPVGVSGGLLFYDNHLFGTDQQGRLEVFYGARNFFEIEGRYVHPRFFGPHHAMDVEANFLSQPEDRFYLRGNDSDAGRDETRFFREQFDITARFRYQGREWMHGAVDVLYEHIETKPEDGPTGDRLTAADPPGLGTVDLITPRLELVFDWTRGERRIYRGTQIALRGDYTHDLNADRFRYGRYIVEAQHFVPVPIFPPTRRLVFRGRLEQVEPLFDGEAIPFHQLPRLGGQRTLRGYRSDRFRDTGSLLLTAEYRYPIWDQFDAVFFVDSGQVFGGLGAVALDRFRMSYGGGIHMLSGTSLGARFEVAWSDEGGQVILTVKPTFGSRRR